MRNSLRRSDGGLAKVKMRDSPGEVLTRSVGFAILSVGKNFTVDEVISAEPGDLLFLGDRTLEGPDLAVGWAGKKLVGVAPIW